ncbi:DNA polymerase [Paenibacillus darwinianus]|uniref:hypothetical protein n=1 Tax=Paenibacillus darwinianus TaxID=1380763 RepID=UPI0004459803|nr:hypothetical protein [Paenibacillus darwinianus]EXX84552.1 DNA polymerase [Paenibacillus darwinianus]
MKKGKVIQTLLLSLIIMLIVSACGNAGKKKMAKLDWYIVQRLAKWYAKKRQRARWFSSLSDVKSLSMQYGLKTLL